MIQAAEHNPSAARTGFLATVGDGTMAGLYGAATIALWFFAIDGWRGELLYTPSLVGSAVLAGGAVSADAEINLSAVAFYTVVHSVVFSLFGIVYAFILSRLPQTPDFPLIAILIFVPLELGFVGGTQVLLPGLAEVLGHGYIATGNVLGAVAMAIYLRFGQPHRDDAPPEAA